MNERRERPDLLATPGGRGGDLKQMAKDAPVGSWPLLSKIESMLQLACVTYLRSDVTEVAVAFHPLPTDTSFEPAVVLYVMIQGRGDALGVHMMQFETPYGLSQELVNSYVKDFADRTANERQALRQAREQGAPESQGLSLGLGTV